MHSAPTDQFSFESGSDKAAPLRARSIGDGTADFDVLEQLHANDAGIAYRAIDQATATEFELRHLSGAALAGRRMASLRRRLRLVELLEHASIAKLQSFDLAATPATVILQPRPAHSLRGEWSRLRDQGQQVLSILSEVAGALVEAREFGLSHGALHAESVRLDAKNRPVLDFTGWDVPEADELPVCITESERATTEFVDGVALAHLIQEALQQTALGITCKELSPRLAAQLKQLIAFAQDEASLTDVDLHGFADCLRGLVECQQSRSATSAEVDVTGELGRTSVLPSEGTGDATSDLPVPGPASLELDQTSEVRVSSQAPTPSSVWQRQLKPGERLGRFCIESKLGEGGMGSVYKAIDHVDGNIVAIKTLNALGSTRRNALLRFQKEARLLASVNNPHVTNLIEVNRDGNLDYIVLEYVDGIDLKHVIKSSQRLSESMAVSIASDVARALVDAHPQGIVHRDIKPENILLAHAVGASDVTDLVTMPRAKLTDFGIARHIDQSASMELTQAGGSLGTPIYMSPEQCKGGRDLSPATDIYSLGVTLFEMLTGQPPFRAEDAMALAAKHCFEPPPTVRDLNPLVSEPLERLIAKCLAKQASDRFVDARHLLAELERLSRGEATDIGMHPVLPDEGKSTTVSNTMEWQLRASAIELWPLVANTERLNRAIGLPPVRYSTEFETGRGVRRFGSIRLAGMNLRWEEHPFEWIEGRKMSVLREFEHGPFRWFMSSVELEPLPRGGTLLRHHVEIAPRNLLGKIAARIESGAKCRRALDRVYSRFDKALNGQLGEDPLVDPYEGRVRLRPYQQTRIADRVDQLAELVSRPELAHLLGDFLLTAPAQEVTQMRPLKLARRWNQERQDLLETLMLGCQVGLLKMQWDVICPTCRVAADTKDFLQEIQRHTNCEACHHDFDSDLAGAVELVFGAHPDVRETKVERYCIGGPGSHPHVVSQIRLAGDESFTLELALQDGEYLVRGPNLSRSITFEVRTVGSSSPFRIDLTTDPEAGGPTILSAGHQVLQFHNATGRAQLIRVERLASRHDALSASQAMAIPRFRELFPQQLLPSGQLMKSENVVMLAARITNQDELYQQLGDASAFFQLQGAIQDLRHQIGRRKGEFVKVEAGCVVAVFARLPDAVEAAVQLHRDSTTNNSLSDIRLAIVVHAGSAIVASTDELLDYGGAMPCELGQLSVHAPVGVTVTEPVYSDPEVFRLLRDSNCDCTLVPVRLNATHRLLTYRLSLE